MPLNVRIKDNDDNKKIEGQSGNIADVNAAGRLLVEAQFPANQPVTLPEYEDFLYRLRTTVPVQIFQGQWGFNGQPLLWSRLINGGAQLREPQDTGHNFIQFTTTGASGDSIAQQTQRDFRYQPSRNHSVTFAAGFGPITTNVRKRAGLFDDTGALPANEGSNGFYVQQDGSGFSFNISTTATGVQQVISIPRGSWNGDNLDGTGPSGLNLTDTELGNVVIWNIDFSWYGASGVQFNTIVGSQRIVLHEESFSFVNADFPFTRTAFLPLRLDMENTGPVTSSTNVFTIGSISYDIENGENSEFGFQFSASTGTISRTVDSTGTIMISIRPKDIINTIVNRGVLLPNSVSLTSSADVLAEVLVGGDTTGGTWIDAGADSIAEYNLTATGYTGGRVIQTSFIAASGGSASGSLISSFPGDLFVANNRLLGTQTTAAIRLTRLANSTTGRAAIGWREVY